MVCTAVVVANWPMLVVAVLHVVFMNLKAGNEELAIRWAVTAPPTPIIVVVADSSHGRGCSRDGEGRFTSRCWPAR